VSHAVPPGIQGWRAKAELDALARRGQEHQTKPPSQRSGDKPGLGNKLHFAQWKDKRNV